MDRQEPGFDKSSSQITNNSLKNHQNTHGKIEKNYKNNQQYQQQQQEQQDLLASIPLHRLSIQDDSQNNIEKQRQQSVPESNDKKDSEMSFDLGFHFEQNRDFCNQSQGTNVEHAYPKKYSKIINKKASLFRQKNCLNKNKYSSLESSGSNLNNIFQRKNNKKSSLSKAVNKLSSKLSKIQYILNLQNKIKKLQQELRVYQMKEQQQRQFQQNIDNYYLNQDMKMIQERRNSLQGGSQGLFLNKNNSLSTSSGKQAKLTTNNSDTLGNQMQFQQMDFTTLMSVPGCQQIEQKSWIFLGTMMIVMGSNTIDYDGTINVFKIVKQAADQMRRQVEKCQDKISLQFFTLKQDIPQINMIPINNQNNQNNSNSYLNLENQIGFDPFFDIQKQNLHNTQTKGLQSQAVRVQSIQESQLYFSQKISYSIKYQALIKAMQYMKNHSWFLRQMC